MKQKLAGLKSEEESRGYRNNPLRIQVLRDEIQKLQVKEKCMWKQISRTDGLKKGTGTQVTSIVELIKEIGEI